MNTFCVCFKSFCSVMDMFPSVVDLLSFVTCILSFLETRISGPISREDRDRVGVSFHLVDQG